MKMPNKKINFLKLEIAQTSRFMITTKTRMCLNFTKEKRTKACNLITGIRALGKLSNKPIKLFKKMRRVMLIPLHQKR
jgi:hypothetical protein